MNIRSDFILYNDFLLVARAGSFSKASQDMFISQSTLSRNVKKLEEQLNTHLFNRLVNGITLTKNGQRLFKTLESVFSIIEKSDIINIDIDKELKSDFVIGTTRNISDYYLLESINKMRIEYPNLTIKLIIDHSPNLAKMLNEHNIDILVDYLPYNQVNENINTVVKSVGNLETCFACTKEYLLKNGKSNLYSLADFKNENIIVTGSSRRRQLLDEALQSNNANIKPIIELPNSKLMIDLINRGAGIGYFIKKEIEEYLDKELVEINLGFELPHNYIGAIYLKGYNDILKEDYINFLKSGEKVVC